MQKPNNNHRVITLSITLPISIIVKLESLSKKKETTVSKFLLSNLPNEIKNEIIEDFTKEDLQIIERYLYA